MGRRFWENASSHRLEVWKRFGCVLTPANPIRGVRANPASRQLAVVTSAGQVHLLRADLTPVWKQPLTVPSGQSRLAFHGERLVVAWGYPEGVEPDGPVAGVYTLDSGRMVWQGVFEGGVGAIQALTVFEGQGDAWGFFVCMGLETVRFSVEEY